MSTTPSHPPQLLTLRIVPRVSLAVLNELLTQVEQTHLPDTFLDHDLNAALAPRTQGLHPTRSIDSAVALLGVVLPGWELTLRKTTQGWDADLVRASVTYAFGPDLHRKTAPYAILEAMLRALISEGTAP